MAYAPIHNFSHESQLSPYNGAPDYQEEHHSADVGEASIHHHPEEATHVSDDRDTTVSIELEAVERSWNDAALLTAKSPKNPRVHSGSSSLSFGKGTATSPFIGVSALKLTPSNEEKHGGGPAPRPWNKDGTWTVEIVTMFVSLAALAAIIGLIAHYDRRALHEWPYRITLNAVIAVLATMSVTTLGISLQNGLSQMKWIRFKESKVPLADMETFDEASRGVLGAIKLLASRRGGCVSYVNGFTNLPCSCLDLEG